MIINRKIKFFNDTFDAEIHEDGTLVFLNYDIEYDIAMAEFGDPKTHALIVFNIWKDFPAVVIVKFMNLSDYELVMLAADWAEHVLPIFEKESNDQLPRRALIAARKYAKAIGKTSDENLSDLSRKAAKAARSVFKMTSFVSPLTEEAKAAGRASGSAAWAAWTIKDTKETALEAARTAMRVINDPSFTEKEKKWQSLRFVDCVASVQSGKPWPPLSATEEIQE